MKSLTDRQVHYDFSRFHPLDHMAGGPRCKGLPGGTRRHLVLWMSYQRPRPLDLAWGGTLCRLGKHKEVPYWNSEIVLTDPNQPPDGYVCATCERDL